MAICHSSNAPKASETTSWPYNQRPKHRIRKGIRYSFGRAHHVWTVMRAQRIHDHVSAGSNPHAEAIRREISHRRRPISKWLATASPPLRWTVGFGKSMLATAQPRRIAIPSFEAWCSRNVWRSGMVSDHVGGWSMRLERLDGVSWPRAKRLWPRNASRPQQARCGHLPVAEGVPSSGILSWHGKKD